MTMLTGPAYEVAPRLLGCRLVRQIDGHQVICRIVETEAYDQQDAASHSYRGQTPRTAVMFGPPGHLYVYFTYGMHYCCNIVTGPEGHGAAVLIRALEPLDGSEIMVANRGRPPGVDTSNGPAKLCQALKIDRSWNGHDLRESPLQLVLQPALPAQEIVRTARIGISWGQYVPWRFYIRGNDYISKL